MSKKEEPRGDWVATLGNLGFRIYQTTYKRKPYIAVTCAMIVIVFAMISGVISFMPNTRASVIKEVSNINHSLDHKIHAHISKPWSGSKVPYNLDLQGSVYGLSANQDLFLLIENPEYQHFFYRVCVNADRFSCSTHHLGEENERPGRIYKLRMFVPEPGIKVHEGVYDSLPPGKYVSNPVSCIRE